MFFYGVRYKRQCQYLSKFIWLVSILFTICKLIAAPT